MYVDARRMSRQHHELDLAAPFTIAEAAAFGLSEHRIRRLVREGTLRRVFAGVYVDNGADDDPLARARAVSLVLPEGAVVTDASAAWLHGVDLMAPGEQVIPPPLSVHRAIDRARVRREGCEGGRRTLRPHEVTSIHGVPVTTPLRTAVDLGRSLRRTRALVAMDALARAGSFDRDRIAVEIPRFKGHRGVVQLRTLSTLVDPLSESPGESRLRLTWLDAGLAAPVPQHAVRAGFRTAYLDLADPRSMFAAEYDGAEWHSSPEQRAHDDDRRRWLNSLGWRISVFTKHDFDGWDDDRARRRIRTEFNDVRHR
jgi:hypothetical protein